KCISDTPEEIAYSTEFELGKYWLLDEHRMKGGDSLLPGTGHLQLVRSAIERRAAGGAVEISDVFFVAPFVVKPGERRELQVRLTREGSGFDFVIRSKPVETAAAEWQEHVVGKVSCVKT